VNSTASLVALVDG